MQIEKSQPKGKWMMLETRLYPLTRELGFLGLHRGPIIDYFSYLLLEKSKF